MRSLASILSLFGNELNKFYDTEARTLDSIYHMTLKFPKNRILPSKRQYFSTLPEG